MLPSPPFSKINNQKKTQDRLKTIALNTVPFILTISRMFYFPFALNFLSPTWYLVLACDGVRPVGAALSVLGRFKDTFYESLLYLVKTWTH